MTTLKINIDNPTDAKALATFLRTLGYVRSVSVEKGFKSIKDEDWILPGRPATEAEINKLIDDMDKEGDEGITTAQLKRKVARWNKGIYK